MSNRDLSIMADERLLAEKQALEAKLAVAIAALERARFFVLVTDVKRIRFDHFEMSLREAQRIAEQSPSDDLREIDAALAKARGQ